MLITYQMESLEELLESITSTLQSQYSSRFIRLANPMALNATPEVLDLNIYAICSLWLSDALSENALDGDPVGDTEVASTFLGFAKLFLEGPDPLLVHWAEVMVAKIHERPTPLWPEELDAVTDLSRHLLYQLYTSPLLNTQALAFAAYKSLCLCWAYFNSKNPHWEKLLPPSMASGLTFFSLGPDQKFLLDSIWEELLKQQEEEQSQNTLAQTNEEAIAEPPITTIFDPESYTEKDAETGLYYYGARYYDPKVSIWLSVDPKAHWYPGHSPYNFSLNNPINLVDPNGQWVEGAGFWNNLFYSDKRNEAMLMAGENGSFEKTDDGWRVTRSNQSSSDNQGDFQGEMLNEVEIIELKDDGERSIDDHAANMVRGVANTGIIVGTALAMPFVALAKNKNIDWEAGDKYTSANPYQLSEDVGFEQMNGSTKEVGKEVMKNTVGLILSFVPGVAGASTLDKAKKSGATSAIKQGVNKAIDEIDD